MRKAIACFALLSCWINSPAQTSVGMFAGPWTDPVFGTNSFGAGALVEHRIADSLNLVLRIGAEQHWCTAEHTSFSSRDTASGKEALHFYRDVETRYTRWTIHAKFPLTTEECSDGFFRGAYALIGIGYANCHTTSRATTVDLVQGTNTVEKLDTRQEAWSFRLGAGLQRAYAWGVLFAEIEMDLSSGREHITASPLVGGSMGLRCGYRYFLLKD